MAFVLEPTWAIVAAVVVVVAVLLLWKLLKFAFKVALIVGAAALIYALLRWSGLL